MCSSRGGRDPRAGSRRAIGRGAILPLLVLLALPCVTGAAPEVGRPHDVALKESIRVDLVQLEVTVWPKGPGSDACLGLTAADFELLVDGKPQSIYAVDSLASEPDVDLPEASSSGSADSAGMSLVLFFDLWHLDLFYRGFACPRTMPLAFAEARRYVEEEFRQGDRLLLVTFAGWPVVHYGWIGRKADALQALNRLEKSRQVLAGRREHLHHKNWIEGMESLFLALGRYRGRKDVVYLADDFRFDDVAMRMYELAARAQSNGVVVNAVDLLESCRKLPGPPCTSEGGLGCTDFREPVVLGPLSGGTGGELFRTERIAAAARQLRAMRRCRYLVSFRQSPRKRRRPPSVTLRLTSGRQDLSLLAPSSFQTAERAPTQGEKDEALFLLPRFGRGIAAEVGVWPYRPAGKRGRWKTFVLVRVERTDDEPWPDELTEISVDVLLHKDSTISGDDLKTLRTTGRQKLLFFPAEDVRPGETTADVTVVGNAEEITANVRTSFEVPKPPGPGEARPWFLSDRVVRFGENALPVPSLDDAVSASEPVSFLAFGCRPRAGGSETYEGRVVPFADGPAVPVLVSWLDASRRDGCGWLLGRIGSPLPAGLWTFEPPPGLAGEKGAAKVEFAVVAEEGARALPAEITPR